MSSSTIKFAYRAGYSALVKAAGLAESTAVRGCAILKPDGFALWESMEGVIDTTFKNKGYVNVYFPLLIPSSYLTKEASHIAGFAKECAVVTHYRVQYDTENKTMMPDADAQLQEPLIIRPTSETIIWHSYKNWIQSLKDLPIRIKQSANVMRWEMRPRLFLRSAEILWQEGHAVFATAKAAQDETLEALYSCKRFLEKYLAIPIILGEKTLHERFSGAEATYTLEALMQDGKALQAGTSHFLGQNFAKAFDVKFTDSTGKRNYVWGSCWGLTTRLIGAMIMVHADSKGLITPPAIAPLQVVIIPILQYGKGDDNPIMDRVLGLCRQLEEKGIRVRIDESELRRPGWKFAEYELKGIPLRVVVGLRELEEGKVTLVRRDTEEKVVVGMDSFVRTAESLLEQIQTRLYTRALAFRDRQIRYVDDYATFKNIMSTERGFLMAHWDGTTATEQKINEETKATIRCIPLDSKAEAGKCIYSGKPSTRRVLFAQAY